MYYFFVGTIAELIKLFPVIKEFEKRNINYKILSTGQNDLSKSDLYPFINVSKIIFLSKSVIKPTAFGLLSWFISNLFLNIYKLSSILHTKNGKNYFIIHGDTVSTLMGALLGFLFNSKIIHIEAGLRSYNIFQPFPEELDRVISSKFVHIHFCPNAWALNNLKQIRGEKVDTLNNTLVESMRFALDTKLDSKLLSLLSGKKYFIFVLHRQENLFNKHLVTSIVKKINQISSDMQCLFVLHKNTKNALDTMNIMQALKENPSIIFAERIPYIEFMHLLKDCEFLITDGGSNQEESYYLGKPCLILRKYTERIEGLDSNAVLSNLSLEKFDDFVLNYKKYIKSPVVLTDTPSSIITSYLIKDTYAK